MKSFADRIADLPHRRLDLTANYTGDARDWPTHRAALSVWADAGDDDAGRVILTLGPEYGHACRYIEMSPQEARALMRHLACTADDVDHVRGQAAADQVKAEGGSAMDQACAQLTACFSDARR